MNEYTAGFLFDEQRQKVLLIHKQRPAWQRGKWNGVGGKTEPGETPVQCQRREFQEETGLEIMNWDNFAWLGGVDFQVHFFRAFSNQICDFQVLTDEDLAIWLVCELPNVIPNLRWLIPMALSMDADTAATFRVFELARDNKRSEKL